MNEKEAREVMRQQRVERDILDTSTCVEIVDRLGLIPDPEPVLDTPEEARKKDQVRNMVAHIGPDRSPYFFS